MHLAHKVMVTLPDRDFTDPDRVLLIRVARVKIMEISLQSLFQAIAQAQYESELRQPVMAQIGEYFAATRWGLSFLDEFPAVDAHTPGFVKLALSLDYNPVLRAPRKIASSMSYNERV
jgi:hypothetical protein